MTIDRCDLGATPVSVGLPWVNRVRVTLCGSDSTHREVKGLLLTQGRTAKGDTLNMERVPGISNAASGVSIEEVRGMS